MRKAINIFWVLILLGMCDACKRTLKIADYVRYVNGKENGLLKKVEVDGFEYSVQYKPYDYIILMENKGSMMSENTGKRKAELAGTAWFNISIKRNDNTTTLLRYGLSSLDQYNTRLDYYLNKAQNDIWLLYGKDTIHPASYLFENNYNLTPQETMVVGFYLPKGDNCPKEKMQLSYNDQVFKNGIIKVTYAEKILDNIPDLTY